MKIAFTDIRTLGYEIDTTGLSQLGEISIYDNLPDEELGKVLALDCPDTGVIITNQNRLGKQNLACLPKLRLICEAGTGYNNIDIEYCRMNGIAVTNVPSYAGKSVAQHTFAMLFYLLSHSRYYDDFMKGVTGKGAGIGAGIRTGAETENARNVMPVLHAGQEFFELEGKTWGIIGLGDIGSRVAAYAEGFSCRVVYHSVTGRNLSKKYEKLSLEQLLAESDIISIHVPLSPLTENLISMKQLRLMKQSAILLNLGRGGIINEADLASALDLRIIGAAGLDVLAHEPPEPGNPLLEIKDLSRIYITPHIAYGSVEARKRLVETICSNIRSYTDGGNQNRIC